MLSSREFQMFDISHFRTYLFYEGLKADSYRLIKLNVAIDVTQLPIFRGYKEVSYCINSGVYAKVNNTIFLTRLEVLPYV